MAVRRPRNKQPTTVNSSPVTGPTIPATEPQVGPVDPGVTRPKAAKSIAGLLIAANLQLSYLIYTQETAEVRPVVEVVETITREPKVVPTPAPRKRPPVQDEATNDEVAPNWMSIDVGEVEEESTWSVD